jgi:hypothetical protein
MPAGGLQTAALRDFGLPPPVCRAGGSVAGPLPQSKFYDWLKLGERLHLGARLLLHGTPLLCLLTKVWHKCLHACPTDVMRASPPLAPAPSAPSASVYKLFLLLFVFRVFIVGLTVFIVGLTVFIVGF